MGANLRFTNDEGAAADGRLQRKRFYRESGMTENTWQLSLKRLAALGNRVWAGSAS